MNVVELIQDLPQIKLTNLSHQFAKHSWRIPSTKQLNSIRTKTSPLRVITMKKIAMWQVFKWDYQKTVSLQLTVSLTSCPLMEQTSSQTNAKAQMLSSWTNLQSQAFILAWRIPVWHWLCKRTPSISTQEVHQTWYLGSYPLGRYSTSKCRKLDCKLMVRQTNHKAATSRSRCKWLGSVSPSW